MSPPTFFGRWIWRSHSVLAFAAAPSGKPIVFEITLVVLVSYASAKTSAKPMNIVVVLNDAQWICVRPTF